ncbi:MAG: M23 family metallopeptidase [Actinobacteria bacterium]|nr:M23 family metallopeptidase [Actinomycetota bacterium]
MSRFAVIRLAVFSAVLLTVMVAIAAAAPPARDAVTEARATIIEITIPGQTPVSLGGVEWPKTTAAEVQSFTYPADGSVVSVGLSRARASAQTGPAAVAQASAETAALSLFGGDVLAAQVSASATAGAGTRTAGADAGGSVVQGLRVLGQDLPSEPAASVALADWGTLQVLAQDTGSRRGRAAAAQGTVAALRVQLTTAHGGLPAGSEIVVGSAAVTAVADLEATPLAPPPGIVGTPNPGVRRTDTTPPPPEPEGGGTPIPGGPVRSVPPDVVARLTSDGFVFPIFGAASFGDSFGGPRPNIPGGWHHGEDIFAKQGTPVLAVADGTLRSVGFIPIGGYRLWLRDVDGNEFYYAHLSAYSPLAVDGKLVKAGDVIGFVGATGDAEGGTPHLHFEIHPAAMVGLGYDGVVAPYPFLIAWRRADDISFVSGRIYVPAGAGPGVPSLPPPGAVLLQAEDIASLSGLVPGALERALERKRG